MFWFLSQRPVGSSLGTELWSGCPSNFNVSLNHTLIVIQRSGTLCRHVVPRPCAQYPLDLICGVECSNQDFLVLVGCFADTLSVPCGKEKGGSHCRSSYLTYSAATLCAQMSDVISPRKSPYLSCRRPSHTILHLKVLQLVQEVHSFLLHNVPTLKDPWLSWNSAAQCFPPPTPVKLWIASMLVEIFLLELYSLYHHYHLEDYLPFLSSYTEKWSM